MLVNGEECTIFRHMSCRSIAIPVRGKCLHPCLTCEFIMGLATPYRGAVDREYANISPMAVASARPFTFSLCPPILNFVRRPPTQTVVWCRKYTRCYFIPRLYNNTKRFAVSLPNLIVI